MAACLGSLATGLLRQARPLSERILHLTPMVSVVVADGCYLHGHYGFPNPPTDLVTTGSRSLGEVLRETAKRFSAAGFSEEFRWTLPQFVLEPPLTLRTGYERLLKMLTVDTMFAIDFAADGGYLFSKDGAADNEEADNEEDCNSVEALIEAVKRKSRSLTRLLQEAEDKKRETDKQRKEEDEKNRKEWEDKKKKEWDEKDRESEEIRKQRKEEDEKNRKEWEDKKKKEWEEKDRESEEIRKQLRQQARFWDRITLRLLLVASRLKGNSSIVTKEEKSRLSKTFKTLLVFLRAPLTAKDVWVQLEDGAALWLVGGVLICVSCYLGEVDFWDIVEGRKLAIINKAERMLGVQAPPGKCFCGADLPTLCAHCGEDLPHFLVRQGKRKVGDPSEVASEGNAGAGLSKGKVGDLPKAASEGNAGAVGEGK